MSEGAPRDPRPRPRYGEYATPQDQAEAIAGSLPPVSPLLAPKQAATREVTTEVGDWAPPSAESRDQVTPSRPVSTPVQTLAPEERPRRRWDVVLSVGLLVYGLISVLSGFASFRDVGAVLDQLYASQGIGDFSSDELARSMGVALNISNVIVLTVTTAITVRVLRARRLAFYIPIAGGALAAVIATVLLAIVMFSDPAFAQYAANGG